MNIVHGKIRSGFLACSIVSVSLLAACSPGQGSESPAPEDSQQAGNAPDVNVIAPKDPASLDSCALLPPRGAESMGLGPEGKASSSSFGEENANRCAWNNPDGSVRASLAVFPDRNIQDYYVNASQYVDFQKLDVSGHPAVRANENDPNADGMCVFFLASKDDQVVQATAQVPSAEVAAVNPCDLAKKTLESAVPSWPAAK